MQTVCSFKRCPTCFSIQEVFARAGAVGVLARISSPFADCGAVYYRTQCSRSELHGYCVKYFVGVSPNESAKIRTHEPARSRFRGERLNHRRDRPCAWKFESTELCPPNKALMYTLCFELDMEHVGMAWHRQHSLFVYTVSSCPSAGAWHSATRLRVCSPLVVIPEFQ